MPKKTTKHKDKVVLLDTSANWRTYHGAAIVIDDGMSNNV
jgi:hypothetical protein